MFLVPVCPAHDNLIEPAKALAHCFHLPFIADATTLDTYYLCLTDDRLELRMPGTRFRPIAVDFLAGKLAHRQRFGGGRGQLIAKAVGLQKYPNLTVLDVTAGLGADAFVLANLGCDVTMIERSPVIATLLDDGLRRLRLNPEYATLKLGLVHCDSLEYLSQLSGDAQPDVIYIDPMFPERDKSALVKKEMRVLRDVVGEDHDAVALLKRALDIAKRRVVVKRPRYAPVLGGRKPGLGLLGKSTRFDIYLSPH